MHLDILLNWKIGSVRRLKGYAILITIPVFTVWFVLLTFASTDEHSVENKHYHSLAEQYLSHKQKRDILSQYNNDTMGQGIVSSSLKKDTYTTESHKQQAPLINCIQPSKIPFNRSAFGVKYKLYHNRTNLYDFPFILEAKNVCKVDKEPFLVIMVLSVNTHIDTRAAIRNTWGRSSNPGVWPRIGDLKQKVKLVFLFGKNGHSLGNKIIAEESKLYGDIVQADFVDSYFNLTYKTVTGLRWVAEYCPGAKYILKADEDVFVHVYNLINFLLKQHPEKRTIYGHTLYNSDVLREGRWGVSNTAYPLPVYPTYTCGNTYVIPRVLASDLYYTAGLLPYLNIEDVFVTGIMRVFIKADIQDVIGFTHWFEKKPKPCEFKNAIRISATKVTEYMQYDLWEGLRSQRVKDCYKVVSAKHVNVRRPETNFINHQLIRDHHIYLNKTSGQFYVL